MKTKNEKQFESEPEEKSIEEAAQEAREILGLKQEATLKDIKKVYRALAKRFHPDKNPGNEEKAAKIFNKLQKLYEIFCDEFELKQDADAKAFEDKDAEEVLEDLGNIFLSIFGKEVDYITRRIIKEYRRQFAQQEEQKGAEEDIVVKGGVKDDEEKGGKADIKV